MSSFPTGLYDLLQTPQLKRRLEEAGLKDAATWADVDPIELPNRIAIHLAHEFAAYLTEIVFVNQHPILTPRQRPKLTPLKVSRIMLDS